MTDRHRGFTLIELMIAVVIMAILTSLSVGGYRQYVQRANRADATAALLRIGAAQERFYLQNGAYASDAELATPPPAGLGMPSTQQNFYELAIAPDAAGLAVGYVATAAAKSDGPQATDDDCQTFTIDQSNARGAEDGDGNSGSAIVAKCWR